MNLLNDVLTLVGTTVFIAFGVLAIINVLHEALRGPEPRR